MRSPTSHSPPYDLNPGYLTMGFSEANPRQYIICITNSKGSFGFFLGKCSMPFSRGNGNLIIPSFMSMIAQTVQINGLPKKLDMMGHIQHPLQENQWEHNYH